MLIEDENKPVLGTSIQSYNAVMKQRDEESLFSSSNSIRTDKTMYSPDECSRNLGKVSLSTLIACLCLSSFLAALDTSVLTTIFNEIGTEFKSSNLSVWIVTAYMLSTSALQPLYGKLSDVFGRKSTLVTTLCIFLIGSILCGIAKTMFQIAAARAVAGLGGGGLITLASVVIHDLIPIRNRGKYQSYVNMSQTVGQIVGAPLGGLIHDSIGWRYCFFINIPPCLFIIYTYACNLKDYNLIQDHNNNNFKQKLERIDFIGAAYLLISNLSFVTAISLGGNTRDWNDPLIIAQFVCASVFLGLFAMQELKWAKHPLISHTLIKNRNVVAVCLNNFFLSSSTMAFSYLIPQYFMGVLGYTASSTGLWVLPRIVLVAFGCWISGQYLASTGRYKRFLVYTHVFQLIAACGTYFWTRDTYNSIRLLCMNVEGFCFGVILVATMVALVADIVPTETASATSMMYLCRSTGWVFGSTVTAAVLQVCLKKNLHRTIKGPEAAEIIEFVRTSITEIRMLAPDVQMAAIEALEQAIRSAFAYGVVCAAMCFISALCLRDCHLGSQHTPKR